jgi:hypothetical protein
MTDLVLVVVALGFFAVATLFVAGCERVVGAREDTDR